MQLRVIDELNLNRIWHKGNDNEVRLGVCQSVVYVNRMIDIRW